MKTTKYILTLLVLLVSVITLSAQSNREERLRRREQEKTDLMEKTHSQPCWRYDDDEYYAATGYMRVKAGGDGERDYALVATKLLNSLRQQVKIKVGGQYKAVVHDYFDQMDVDDKSSAASHIESAGEQIIDTFLNDTEEDCRQFSTIDEAGYMNLYIGILVLKSELINKLVDDLQESNSLSASEKALIRNNEKAFRDEAFKQFGAKQE